MAIVGAARALTAQQSIQGFVDLRYPRPLEQTQKHRTRETEARTAQCR